MWKEATTYNLNIALKVNNERATKKSPSFILISWYFFLANYIILLGPAIFKHLGSAVLICIGHNAHPPPLSFAQGSASAKVLRSEQNARQLSSCAASWGTRLGEMWQEGWRRRSLGSLASSLLLPQERHLGAVLMLCLFAVWRCCGSYQYPQRHFCLVFLWIPVVHGW